MDVANNIMVIGRGTDIVQYELHGAFSRISYFYLQLATYVTTCSPSVHTVYIPGNFCGMYISRL